MALCCLGADMCRDAFCFMHKEDSALLDVTNIKKSHEKIKRKPLTPDIDCDLTAMGLSPATSALFLIAK
jgi:hypothetical protein